MSATVFLLTPPFTQLNTPYPATAYLKGFLNTKEITSFQADLGIEITLALFCRQGLEKLFSALPADKENFSENAKRIVHLQREYIECIDEVISFLQGKQPTLAHIICKRNFLPEASRFNQLDDLEWAFGSMGIQDMAKHYCTLYLEDLSDLIKECVDEHFGFSRYAEKLARSANEFEALYLELQKPYTYTDQLLFEKLEAHIKNIQPKLVCISVPFPGNLFSALRCGEWIKKQHPGIKVAIGGGFPNTELRSLSEPRVFEFVDYITLDDGERPIENLIAHINGELPVSQLVRTFTLIQHEVIYINNHSCHDYKQSETGTPDYSDFYLDKYISAIEIVNPMHRMWSDGRWNKLTMAHGCYWGKCTFCDITLDYIKNYEPVSASLLCDRMEAMIAQTGVTGFHFVDEAAPPSLMRALSIEIIKRKLKVSWWTNIRFEKSFTSDLCFLLQSAGCIAVSGGLEVASDRLLALIQKGVTVAQVATVTRNFTKAGIMVHAYMMYGFPTQTAQETIDSLEMVRQLFKTGVLQSGFWHLFTMTVHSPVGQAPEKYGVQKENNTTGSFANNDMVHIDDSGTDHEAFSYGLKKSLLNYMHRHGLDEPLHKWFDFKIPKTTVTPDYIENILNEPEAFVIKPHSKIIWLGSMPDILFYTKSKKGQQWEMAALSFHFKKESYTLQVSKEQGVWLQTILPMLSIQPSQTITYQELEDNYYASGLTDDFELFWHNKMMNHLGSYGLLCI